MLAPQPEKLLAPECASGRGERHDLKLMYISLRRRRRRRLTRLLHSTFFHVFHPCLLKNLGPRAPRAFSIRYIKLKFTTPYYARYYPRF